MASSTAAVVFSSIIITVSLLMSRVIYNLIFHPLSGIPGPRKAAFSSLWLFYMSFRGCAYEEISLLHKQYGPVVRISPNEVSVFDINIFHKSIYAQNTKFQKAGYYYHAFHADGPSVFSETDKNVHSKEKRLMTHAFSRANLLGYTDVIYNHTAKWIGQLQRWVQSDRTIPFWHAAQCLTLDTVSAFSFGYSTLALEGKDFHNPIFVAVESFEPYVVLFQFFHFLKPVVAAIQKLFSLGTGPVDQIAEKALQRLNDQDGDQDGDGMLMFDSMISRAKKGGINLDRHRLIQNGALMLGAGTGTTALTLTTAIYHLNANQELWKELQTDIWDKLGNISESRPSIVELENIPLLEACIKEALRLCVPIRGRFPRVVPEGGLDCHGFHLPANSIVSSSAGFYCHDPTIYPQPLEYHPKRWLEAENVHELQHNLVAFSHGSRSCIGQSFAQMELKIALSQVISHFNPGRVMDEDLSFLAYSLTAPKEEVSLTLKARQ